MKIIHFNIFFNFKAIIIYESLELLIRLFEICLFKFHEINSPCQIRLAGAKIWPTLIRNLSKKSPVVTGKSPVHVKCVLISLISRVNLLSVMSFLSGEVFWVALSTRLVFVWYFS